MRSAGKDKPLSQTAQLPETTAHHQRPAFSDLRFQIGITDSLPKLVTYEIIKPIFKLEQPVQAVCREGKAADLLSQLAAYRQTAWTGCSSLKMGLMIS